MMNRESFVIYDDLKIDLPMFITTIERIYFLGDWMRIRSLKAGWLCSPTVGFSLATQDFRNCSSLISRTHPGKPSECRQSTSCYSLECNCIVLYFSVAFTTFTSHTAPTPYDLSADAVVGCFSTLLNFFAYSESLKFSSMRSHSSSWRTKKKRTKLPFAFDLYHGFRW